MPLSPFESTSRQPPSRRSGALVSLLASACIGAFCAWAVPAAWFLPVFLLGIGTTLLLGVVTACLSQEPRLPTTGLEVVSFLSIGTTTPSAKVPPGLPLSLFQLAAAFVVGMGAGVLLLARV
jgi:hypothetical protein